MTEECSEVTEADRNSLLQELRKLLLHRPGEVAQLLRRTLDVYKPWVEIINSARKQDPDFDALFAVPELDRLRTLLDGGGRDAFGMEDCLS